jgi:hypothetical protein
MPIDNIAYIMPKEPKIVFFENVDTIWLIMPKPGKIRI